MGLRAVNDGRVDSGFLFVVRVNGRSGYVDVHLQRDGAVSHRALHGLQHGLSDRGGGLRVWGESFEREGGRKCLTLQFGERTMDEQMGLSRKRELPHPTTQ